MFDKCRVCGASTFSFHRPDACPKCGAPRSAVEPETVAASGALGLPQRKNASLGDHWKLEQEKVRHNMGLEGTLFLPTSWEEELQDRPHDSPFYTAPKGIAHIAVLLAQSSVPDPAVLDLLVRARLPFLLHCKAFPDAGYPILRMNLYIPDNPADPLCLESPLDIRDGDAQDFLEAVQQREQIRLVLTHEAAPSNVVTLIADAPGLAALVREEVGKLLHAPADGGESAFRAAVERMKQVFPQANDGIDSTCLLEMAVFADVDFHAVARKIIEIMTPYFQKTGPLTEANAAELKEIGWNLHRGGGKDAMLQAFEIVSGEASSRRYQSVRLLEIIWGGVGDWRG